MLLSLFIPLTEICVILNRLIKLLKFTFATLIILTKVCRIKFKNVLLNLKYFLEWKLNQVMSFLRFRVLSHSLATVRALFSK